jgi:chromosome segregation ATPase
LDINLVKLTRKYQTLAEQEDLLRRDYHSREADLADKDVHVQTRINELKKWKAKAIQQIKFLFTKLRLAVPLTEYQGIQSENDLLKQRNADYIDRNSRLAERVARLQTQVRENLEAEEKLRAMQEQRDDLENEYEVVRKRLEHCDPQFKWENAIFTKIVTVLKRFRVSPQ